MYYISFKLGNVATKTLKIGQTRIVFPLDTADLELKRSTKKSQPAWQCQEGGLNVPRTHRREKSGKSKEARPWKVHSDVGVVTPGRGRKVTEA